MKKNKYHTVGPVPETRRAHYIWYLRFYSKIQ